MWTLCEILRRKAGLTLWNASKSSEVFGTTPEVSAMDFKVRALKNVASSWAGLAVNVAVGFFLSPFILHHLGDEAFGLWVLIFSLTGYYGLFDFGIRSSLIRY